MNLIHHDVTRNVTKLGQPISFRRKPPGPLAAPVNIVPPSISGVAAVGSVLTCTPGVWTGNPSPAKSYEWMVGNSPIAGAEGLTYTVQAGAAGNPIKIREIATNSEGIHSLFSNAIEIP